MLSVYYDGGMWGGIERFLAASAASAADDADVDLSFACTAGGLLESRLKALGVRTHGLRALPGLAGVHLRPLDLPLVAHVACLAAGADVAHVHIGHWEHLGLRLAARRIVYTLHGYGSLYRDGVSRRQETTAVLRTGPRDAARRAGKRVVRGLLRRFLARTDALTVVSASERDRLAAEGYLPTRPPAQVLPPPVDTAGLRAAVADLGRDAARARFRISEKTPVLAWFGRMEAGKNPILAIEAAERLMDGASGERPVLLMAGDGALGPVVAARAAQSRHAGRIRLLGRLADITPLLAASDAALFTSESEGFGLGLVEAAAVGLPLVAAPVGAALELFGDAPEGGRYLAAAGDAEAFARRAEAWLTATPSEREAVSRWLRDRAEPYDVGAFWWALRSVYFTGRPGELAS